MVYRAKTDWQVDETVTENDLNRIEHGIKDAYEASVSKLPLAPISLQPGRQVIESDVVAPLTGLQIKGRTLVNLLGRSGNCEDTSKWGLFSATHVLDSSNKTVGNNSIKLTISGSFGNDSSPSFSFKAGKFYIVLSDLKNGNATNITIHVNGDTATKGTHIVTTTDKFNTAWRAYNPSSDVPNCSIVVQVNGAAGQYGYFDAVRVYEITRAEYDALDSMMPEQIAEKWPYVDDMKSVYSPYIIKNGENLLPPFTGWNVHQTAGKVIEPYLLHMETTSTNQYTEIKGIKVVPGQRYTLSLKDIVLGQKVVLEFYDKSGVYLNGSAIESPAKSITLLAPNSAETATIYTTNTTATISYTLENPILNVGSVENPFKPKNDDQLFFPNVQLASNVGETVHDTLFQCDGKYWKNTQFRTMNLTGDLNWILNSDFSGFKEAAILNFEKNCVANSETVVKYNGKVLPTSRDTISDSSNLQSVGHLLIRIPDTDSGWGEDYRPSDEEVKAYFYGWKMWHKESNNSGVPYNGVGTRAWKSYATGAETTVLPRSSDGAGYRPYHLLYQLSTPTVEEIASEGGITLHQGANQMMVGTGLVVRERVTPIQDWQGVTINNYSIGYELSRAKWRVREFFGVYANGRREDWKYADLDTTGGYGGIIAVRGPGMFNPVNTYTVTYLAMDQHALTCSVQSVQFERAANMKAVVDTLAAGQSDMAERVGALEISIAQRAKPQWITPTLLNGWVNLGNIGRYDAAYLKDSAGSVYIRGTIKNGALTMAAFILPAGYRPSKTIVCLVQNAASNAVGKLVIRSDGAVIPNEGTNTEIGFDTISFLAEQ